MSRLQAVVVHRTQGRGGSTWKQNGLPLGREPRVTEGIFSHLPRGPSAFDRGGEDLVPFRSLWIESEPKVEGTAGEKSLNSEILGPRTIRRRSSVGLDFP